MKGPEISLSRHQALLKFTWWAILFVAIADALWLKHDGISLAHKPVMLAAITSLCMSGISYFYCHIRRDDGLWLVTQVTAQLIAGSLVLGTLSYLGCGLALPLIDANLAAFDKALGFGWLSYISWVDQHPFIAHIYTFCYLSTGPELIAILAILSFCRRMVALHCFALAVLMSGLITVLMSAFWPVLPAYSFYGIAANSYPHLQIAHALDFVGDITAMRTHMMPVLPEMFQGLIGFPSFHSALAVICIQAACSVPGKPVCIVIVMLNLIMLASTPVDGGHYLADTLSGIALGLLTIAAIGRLAGKKSA